MKQMPEIKAMIGLEIHTYLITKEKLFCRCRASREKGLKSNINICPICTGMPGAKPMAPNKEAVKQAVRIGMMLGCKINAEFFWQRKHYSWPDLPKGYQNTISGASAVPIGENGEFQGIGIWSMHLEEDPAAWDPETGQIDYNRSGLPLVEIVTAPDFTDAEEVGEWLGRLLHNLNYLKAVDGDAGIKVDVNVNLVNYKFTSPKTSISQEDVLGLPGKTERVEIKNLNSIESIKRAIIYEIERQAREGSERETRRFDAATGKTARMRGKEEAEDYRFIREPDLQDINLGSEMIEDLRKSMPETPERKLEKMIKKFNIGKEDAGVLTKHLDIAEFFEEVVDAGIDAKFALPWVTIELLRILNYNKTSLDKSEIKVEHFAELLKLVQEGKITELKAKQILNGFYPKSSPVAGIAGKEGKISDKKELGRIILGVIEKNKKAVEDYKRGEKNAFNYLMGEIMKVTNKRADFWIARQILEEKLREI